jgi:hypothetical protein
MSEKIIEKIKSAQRIGKLELVSCGLTEMPQELSILKNLRSINLYCNPFKVMI